MIVAGFGFAVLIALSVLSFKEMNAILFELTAGVALMVGLNAPRAVGEAQTMMQGIGMITVAYAFLCLIFCYVRLIQRNEEN